MKPINFSFQQKPKIPALKAVLYIFLSVLIISGSAAATFYYYRHLRYLRSHDPKYNVVALIQTGPEKEALKTVYLAELLNLSHDKPTNLYLISSQEAEKKLKSCPVIKEAIVKKIPPGTLYIDYTVRQPVAYLGDYKNAAIDKEGMIFPFRPFFTPKRLPELYLGEFSSDSSDEFPLPVNWGEKTGGIRSKLALDLLELIQTSCCTKDNRLLRLDVSKATYPSNGQREIVVVFEELSRIDKDEVNKPFKTILRLSSENYRQELANYLTLRESLVERNEENIIVDLRLPHLAFIQGKEH